MTDVELEEAAAANAAARGVRRIFLVALAAAVIAAGVALGVELSHHPSSSSSVAPRLLPLTFNEEGFSDGPIHREQQAIVPADQRRHVLHIAGPGGTVVYIVVRCDRGTATASLGGLASGAGCSGRAAGVVRLTLAKGGPDLQVTVNRAQRKDWAIGIYR